MSYTIAANGDPLEREAATFIQNWLPHYETIWAMYIGNNGHNELADIPAIKSQTNE